MGIKLNNKINMESTRNKIILKLIILTLSLSVVAIIMNQSINKMMTYEVTVVGESMEPKYKDGQVVKAKIFTEENKKDLKLKQNDVIVTKEPGNPNVNVIKRIAGVPGDKIDYALGTLFVNGKVFSSPNKEMSDKEFKTLYKAYLNSNLEIKPEDGNKLNKITTARSLVLGEKQYWIVSDNLGIDTVDSRTFGPANESDLLGIVIK